MAKQEVVFKNAGDTGERDDIEAIEPILSGERVGQVVLQRPSENLRHRTEVDRTELELQKYLQDSDMRWVIAGGAPDGSAVGSIIPYINWDPISGVFTITGPMVVQPLSTPDRDKQDSLVYNFDDTINTGSVTVEPEATERSYNGANRLEVIWDDTKTPAELPLGAEAVLTGDPLHILTIYIKNDTTTTVGQVDAALALILPASGFQYSTGGNAATQIPGIDPLPADATMSATFERELHIIDPPTLNDYFTGPPPAPLTEGDTLAIWYDEITEDDPSTAGRRQSCISNGNTILVSGQITNLTTHPERIPIAIPLCKRIGDDLLFIDGTVVAGALPSGLVPTPFGAHGYVLDLIYGGGVFNDTIYQAWLGVAAATFQAAWDNFIGVMDQSVSTQAAGLLGFDDSVVLQPTWGLVSPNIQDTFDTIVALLALGPIPTSNGPCGAAHIGFDGLAPSPVSGLTYDFWTSLLSTDVWAAVYNMMDAMADFGAWTGSPGASRIGVAANGAPAGASNDRWSLLLGTAQATFEDIQDFTANKASLNVTESVTGNWDFQAGVDFRENQARVYYCSRPYNVIQEGFLPFGIQAHAGNPNEVHMSPGRALVDGMPIKKDTMTLSIDPSAHLLNGVTLDTTLPPDDFCFWLYVWLRKDGEFRFGLAPPRNDQGVLNYSIPGNTYYRIQDTERDPGFVARDYVLCGVVWRYKYDNGTGDHYWAHVVPVGGGLWRYQNAMWDESPGPDNHLPVRHRVFNAGISSDTLVAVDLQYTGDPPEPKYIARSPGIPLGLSYAAYLHASIDVDVNAALNWGRVSIGTQSITGPLGFGMVYPTPTDQYVVPTPNEEAFHTRRVNGPGHVRTDDNILISPDSAQRFGLAVTMSGPGVAQINVTLTTLGFFWDRMEGNGTQAVVGNLLP